MFPVDEFGSKLATPASTLQSFFDGGSTTAGLAGKGSEVVWIRGFKKSSWESTRLLLDPVRGLEILA